MSGGQHRVDEVKGRASGMNVNPKESRATETAPDFTRRCAEKNPKRRTNLLDEADFVRDVINTHLGEEESLARSFCRDSWSIPSLPWR